MNPYTHWFFSSLPKLVLTFGLSASYSLVVAQTPDAEPTQAEPAESFTLFGSVDSAGGDSSPRGRDTRGRGGNSARNGTEPEFTLVGTSRIGSRYSAILKNKNGDEVRVATSPDTNTPVSGFSSYAVVDVGAGSVSLQYPPGSSCIEFEDQGVSCNMAGNIASLSLTNADPLTRQAPEIEPVASENDETALDSAASADEVIANPDNPFAALRARAQAAGNDGVPAAVGQGQRRQLNLRRIPDEDIPPGMRRVATPFGDRLVPQ